MVSALLLISPEVGLLLEVNNRSRGGRSRIITLGLVGVIIFSSGISSIYSLVFILEIVRCSKGRSSASSSSFSVST